MSGYDALDELYDRLRGTEDAQHAPRAGGITPEAIRAARGGVVDGCWRGCHVADENAAGGDSVPLAGVSRDSRERIEADLLALTKSWHDHDGDFMKIYGSVAYAQIKELLDRQAALTEREICKWWRDEEAKHDERIHRISELQRQCDELNDKLMTALNNQKTLEDRLWEYDGTHMLLPVDADGVPCRVGDKMKYADGTEFEVDGIGSGGTLFSVDDASNSAWWTNAEDKRHAPERTVESVLSEFASRVLNSGHQWGLDAPDMVPEFAAEIRELMANDGLAPENGVSAHGWRSNDGEVAL